MIKPRRYSADLKATRKLINFIILSFLCLLALSVATGYYLFVRKYQRLEDMLELDRRERILRTIASSREYLAATSRDWAVWEDTWRYMEGENPDFEESNLSLDSLLNLNLNLMSFVTRDGSVLWQLEADLQEEAEVESGDFPQTPFPPSLLEFALREESPGLAVVGNRVMLLVAHPVLESSDSVDGSGFLVIGRELTSVWTEELAHMINVDFLVCCPDVALVELDPKSLARLEEEKYILDKGKDWIRSYTLIEDRPEGTPSVVIIAENNRGLMALGWRTFFLYLVLTLAGVTGVGLSFIRFMTVNYLSSVRDLYNNVVRIREEGDLDFRIPVQSNDEFGLLCKGFNSLMDVIREQTVELNRKNLHLHEQANRDELTGLYNKRFYRNWLESRQSSPCPEGKCTGAFLMLDIDHFKLYNDRYGHMAGDMALRNVAKALERAVTRTTDFSCRYGGEEFLIILENTDHGGAERVAQRIMAGVASLAIEHADSPTSDRLTVSIGISWGTISCTVEALEELVKRADEALYRSKTEGRNRYTSL